MLKVIVTQRVDDFQERSETRDALDQKVLRWVMAAGGLPFPVPNIFEHDVLIKFLEQVNPDAVLLTGGNDIGQFPPRDATENNILNWARLNDIPVLGICRGMQMIVTWSGGSLTDVRDHVGVCHHINGVITANVNSYHKYTANSVPDAFIVTARAMDGSIESISHRHWSCEGWMWHPERDTPFNPMWLERFHTIVMG